MWGEGELENEEWNRSRPVSFKEEGILEDGAESWNFSEGKQTLALTLDGEELTGLIVFAGHDWENEMETVLFTGLDACGRSVWGKRIK